MDFNLYIWRQKKASEKGSFRRYEVKDVDPDASFLEMLDVLNDNLV